MGDSLDLLKELELLSILLVSLIGLLPHMSGTTYDVYIQSECASQGINSPWYGPITLETPCGATSKPYIEGFENLAGTFGSATFPNLGRLLGSRQVLQLLT